MSTCFYCGMASDAGNHASWQCITTLVSERLRAELAAVKEALGPSWKEWNTTITPVRARAEAAEASGWDRSEYAVQVASADDVPTLLATIDSLKAERDARFTEAEAKDIADLYASECSMGEALARVRAARSSR